MLGITPTNSITLVKKTPTRDVTNQLLKLGNIGEPDCHFLLDSEDDNRWDCWNVSPTNSRSSLPQNCLAQGDPLFANTYFIV